MGQSSKAISDAVSNGRAWHMFGNKVPKTEVVFFMQVFLIYIVVITSIVNLSINRDEGKL